MKVIVYTDYISIYGDEKWLNRRPTPTDKTQKFKNFSTRIT